MTRPACHPLPGRLGLLALLSLLGACAPVLPVIVPPMDCPVSQALLDQRCDEPRPLPDGMSYADLIAVGMADRHALRRCALHDKVLADSLRACQEAIKVYNGKLELINQRAQARP